MPHKKGVAVDKRYGKLFSKDLIQAQLRGENPSTWLEPSNPTPKVKKNDKTS